MINGQLSSLHADIEECLFPHLSASVTFYAYCNLQYAVKPEMSCASFNQLVDQADEAVVPTRLPCTEAQAVSDWSEHI